jgi:mono/diheme cytochrome c family protein
MRFPRIAAVAMLAAAFAWSPLAPAADAERGRNLYESHCAQCHAESVHGREKRAATDFESARSWVRRWGANLGLAWTDDDVNDVTVYLNSRYYRFRCPATVCKATGQIDNAAALFATRQDETQRTQR